MSYQVKAEKIIARNVTDVFNALKEGRLFLNCGASSEMKMDFQVGGQYKIFFKNHNVFQFGEFLEIIPNKKIVFSWCQTFGADQKPDTTVSIELFSEGDKTKLVLQHTGFTTQAGADEHQNGWNGGIADLTEEIQNGRLRIVRAFTAPLEQAFEYCQNPKNSFTSKGKILEIIPNQKILMSWPEGKVTLLFTEKNDHSTRIEFLHEGLNTQKNPLIHRKDWEAATDEIANSIAKRN